MTNTLPPHLELKETGSSGRGLFSTRVIPKGDIIFSSPAAATALHRKHLPLFCQNCFTYTEDVESPCSVVCQCCMSTYYCSQKCYENDADLHSPHCSLLSQVLTSKALKKEESCHVRLLLRLLSRCYLDSNVLTSVEMMMLDHKGIPGFKRRSLQREKAATYFLSMLPPVVEKEKVKEEEKEEEKVKEEKERRRKKRSSLMRRRINSKVIQRTDLKRPRLRT